MDVTDATEATETRETAETTETFTEFVLAFLERRGSMKFIIEMDIENVAMKTYPSIRAAIKEALMPARLARNTRNFNRPHEGDSGKIMDVNGNTVGTWAVSAVTVNQGECLNCGYDPRPIGRR